MTGTWHLDDERIEDYRSGEITSASAASVEQHVLACESCRARMSTTFAADRSERMWAGILERVDAPTPRPVERVLRHLGVSDPTSRLLAATPSLQMSWLFGVGIVLLLSLGAAHTSSSGGVGIFLILAPVLPVLGVAAAFAPRTDPLHEITAASPYSSFRLLVVRSLAVVAVTIALDSLAALLLPGAAWVAVAWLLPTLALTAATLALSTAFDPVRAGLGVSAGWLLLTVPPRVLGKDPLLAVRSSAQLLSMALIAGATIVLFARSNSAPVPLRRNS
jgi:hypothetical protein